MRTTKLLIAAAAAAVASPALAGTTVLVTATIGDTCTLDTGSGALAVSQDAVKNGTSVPGSLSVWCTQGYAAKINAAHTGSLKTTAGDSISYALYTDNAATTAFSNVGFTGTALASASTVNYFLKTTATNPKAGTYTDTITFTIAP